MSEDVDLRERIQRSYGTLRRSERLVADYLSRTTGRRLDHSITDLARLIGVSEATVSRVSRALGFQGYPDMKLSIAAASNQNGGFSNLPAEIVPTDSLPDISRKLASGLSRSLFETEQSTDPAKLDLCINAMLKARKVVFMGVGGAGAICEEAEHIFLKIGIDAASYSDGYTQTVVASTMKPDCVLVAISHTGTTGTVVSAVHIARQNGARTIGITGDAASDLAGAADIVFATTRRPTPQVPFLGDFLEGRMCQLFLIDVIYLGLMFRLDAAARENLETTTRALATHFGAPVTAAPDERDEEASGPGGTA